MIIQCYENTKIPNCYKDKMLEMPGLPDGFSIIDNESDDEEFELVDFIHIDNVSYNELGTGNNLMANIENSLVPLNPFCIPLEVLNSIPDFTSGIVIPTFDINPSKDLGDLLLNNNTPVLTFVYEEQNEINSNINSLSLDNINSLEKFIQDTIDKNEKSLDIF